MVSNSNPALRARNGEALRALRSCDMAARGLRSPDPSTGSEPVGRPFSTARGPRRPAVKIKKRQEGDIMVLELSGKIMGGDDFDLFNNTIRELVKDGFVDIVLNLKGVKWINSTGLGLMVSAYTSLVKQGGRMKVCEVSDRIDNILHVTQLELIFETFDKEPDAIGSFN
jgi:anti-sigma B factor antagonist